MFAYDQTEGSGKGTCGRRDHHARGEARAQRMRGGRRHRNRSLPCRNHGDVMRLGGNRLGHEGAFEQHRRIGRADAGADNSKRVASE